MSTKHFLRCKESTLDNYTRDNLHIWTYKLTIVTELNLEKLSMDIQHPIYMKERKIERSTWYDRKIEI